MEERENGKEERKEGEKKGKGEEREKRSKKVPQWGSNLRLSTQQPTAYTGLKVESHVQYLYPSQISILMT